MKSGKLVELGYAAGWKVVRALPEPVAWRLFRAAADRAARRRGPGTRRLEANLRRVVGPDLPEDQFRVLVRDSLRSYARYWMEAFRLPDLTPEQVKERIQFENAELVSELLDRGQGLLMALPHAGNWDFAGAWVCANGWKLTTVAERLRPEGLYRRFVAYRESLGMEIIPASGGDRSPIEILAERLAANHVVPLVADRDLSARGIEVDFFGERATMPAGPALLALRTGAPLVMVALWYEDQVRPRGRIYGPVEVPPADGRFADRVRQLTQTIANHMAADIAQHPADWHMLQRLWLDDRREPPAVGSDRPAS